MKTLLKILAHALARDPVPCWIDYPAKAKDDRLHSHGGSDKVARYLYHALVGPLDPNHMLASLCKNPRCVNPHHYRASNKRNGLRAARRFQRIKKETSLATSPLGLIASVAEDLIKGGTPFSYEALRSMCREFGVPASDDDILKYTVEFPDGVP